MFGPHFKTWRLNIARIFSCALTFSLLPFYPDHDSNYCFTESLDQIWMKKASLALESRRQKEMNASILASFRHIKADYHWKTSLRYIVKFKEDVTAE